MQLILLTLLHFWELLFLCCFPQGGRRSFQVLVAVEVSFHSVYFLGRGKLLLYLAIAEGNLFSPPVPESGVCVSRCD